MNRRTLLGTVGAALATSLAGCTSVFDQGSYRNGEYIMCRGGNQAGRIDYDCDSFDGATGRYFAATAGDRVAIDHSADLERGMVHFVLLDPTDAVLWEDTCDHARQVDGSGEVTIRNTGRHHARVEGHNARGHYGMTWEVVP